MNVMRCNAVRKWAKYEFFYPTIDREFFAENEFASCLQKLGIDPSKFKKTPLFWKAVRAVIGNEIGLPRRFSSRVLAAERDRLEKYRQDTRTAQWLKAKNPTCTYSHGVCLIAHML